MDVPAAAISTICTEKVIQLEIPTIKHIAAPRDTEKTEIIDNKA